MKLVQRDQVSERELPGRVIQLVVGQEDAASPSNVMTMGYAHYAAESGPMAPHRHAEEIVVVTGSDRGYTRCGGFGAAPNELGERIQLEVGDILHFPKGEWHVFEFEQGGMVDIIFFYSKSDIYSDK